MTVRIPIPSDSSRCHTLRREQALFHFCYPTNRGGYETCNMEIRLMDASINPVRFEFEFEHHGNKHTILIMPNVGSRLLSIKHSRDLWHNLVTEGWKHE